jgi:hypothetical protein
MYLSEMEVIIEKYPENEEEEARANLDEYEVEGEVIDIEDGDDDEDDEEDTTNQSGDSTDEASDDSDAEDSKKS